MPSISMVFLRGPFRWSFHFHFRMEARNTLHRFFSPGRTRTPGEACGLQSGIPNDLFGGGGTGGFRGGFPPKRWTTCAASKRGFPNHVEEDHVYQQERGTNTLTSVFQKDNCKLQASLPCSKGRLAHLTGSDFTDEVEMATCWRRPARRGLCDRGKWVFLLFEGEGGSGWEVQGLLASLRTERSDATFGSPGLPTNGARSYVRGWCSKTASTWCSEPGPFGWRKRGAMFGPCDRGHAEVTISSLVE